MATKKAEEAVAEAPESVESPAAVMGYQVVGVHAVHGVKPGDFIEQPLTTDEVKFLIGAGAIALVEKKGA